jgi:hypothetical protein
LNGVGSETFRESYPTGVGSFPNPPDSTPTGWFVLATGLAGAPYVSYVYVVCQTPITVAGIGVPQFGSLYIAIALGAVVYFLLVRRYASPKTARVQLG